MARTGPMMRWSWVLGGAVRTLPTGSFSFVMASGIVSTAFAAVGWSVPSAILLVIAVAGLLILAAMTVWRFAVFRSEVLLDARNPVRAFGFFTIVAAINVVGVRLYSSASPTLTIVLAALSVPLWLLFTYGLPGNLMLRPLAGPVAGKVDGSWFLWVVGTQSLATAAATIGGGSRSPVLAAIAVALWGIGVLLYLMLATLVTLRLLTVPSKPSSFTPSYWIYMGATAITVLAGSRILLLPQDLPVMAATVAVVSGLTYMLWAFGAWWVPLLVIFGLWRHLMHREPVRYEAGLWSIVFPLGMYSVASMHFGAAARLPLLVSIGEAGTWVAGAAWLIVAAAMAYAGYCRLLGRPAPVTSGPAAPQ
ncbi:tellurite resistance/C4-dicarboxylate transporter family protein [Arthrobacter sp. H14-L1]|uniref:tellurite resistance/C4-dicarboxylate transporter family protein n=1 Tax=Arthrobacter sp. H14-L1 TaxID=2996697 RepID=UPI0022721FA7|nr:tellurite resistance/C4-dicarboxylate transporter family protein [Arthrobacter sp. H14-L1]MCY0906482.1 tellurite resistance/C4-dicarboxylate transporter family protein [Arthrobacter sp. H14-L1]